MSGWLSGVLAGYLDRVSEREFDPVFITYLRSLGYTDIHQTHGPFEFGKDFIAKRDGRQFVFQTKAGDLTMSEWRDARQQVDEMLWNDISHPSFDTSRTREAVLVTTGRLTGAAAADAQQFRLSLSGGRSEGRSPRRIFHRRRRRYFDVWDRDTLLAGLAETPDVTLNGSGADALRELLGLLADIDRRIVSVQTIERASRGWLGDELSRTCLAASVIGSRLLEADRSDLACTTSYALMRSLAFALHTRPSESILEAMDAARAMFSVYGGSILDSAAPTADDAMATFLTGPEVPGLVAYPIRCSVIIETLGMIGLMHADNREVREAERVADLLARFVTHQPGAAHPISDRWAISLVPASAMLRRYIPDVLVPWLEQVVIWICDRHEQSAGLASVHATPREEVRRFLGDPYEHVALEKRTQSYLATIVLDLASALELSTLYADSLNDFLAVGLAFPVMEALDELGQYSHDGLDMFAEANVTFNERQTNGAWQRAPHHHRAPGSYTLQRAGRSAELMAISLLLRDRHFLSVTRELAGLS